MRNIFKLLALLFCLTVGAGYLHASEPQTGAYNNILPTVFGWILRSDEGMQTLEVYADAGRKLFTKYDLSECMFCEGEDDNCDMDGIFGYAHASLKGPMIGVVCHKGAHSQRFLLFSPLQDAAGPLVRVTGNYYVTVRPEPDGIDVRYDKGEEEQDEHISWPSGYKSAKPVSRKAVRFVKPALKSHGAAGFHDRLRTWIMKQDAAELMLHVDEDVVIELGGKKFRGKKEFSRLWGLSEAVSADRESGFWAWAAKLVDAGPAEYQSDPVTRLTYPFMNRDWAAKNNGAYRVALSSGVRIHAGPERSATVLTRIDHEAVWNEEDAMHGLPELEGWSAVRTAEGVYGFISHEDSIVPDDDSLEFVFRGGKWVLQHCTVREH